MLLLQHHEPVIGMVHCLKSSVILNWPFSAAVTITCKFLAPPARTQLLVSREVHQWLDKESSPGNPEILIIDNIFKTLSSAQYILSFSLCSSCCSPKPMFHQHTAI